MIATRNSLLEIISPRWTQPDLFVVAFIVIFVLLSWQPSNRELDWSRHPWAKSSVLDGSKWMSRFFILGLIAAAVCGLID